MLERLQQKLSQGKEAKGKGKRKAVLALNTKQLRVLEEYQSGELRRKANKLTMVSGHGRLKKEDDSFVDIGGSTGGFVRTVLDDWEPPDLADFEGDLSFVW
jgi:predicted rRNA methylase YqxC with S4 and FtsJ domains